MLVYFIFIFSFSSIFIALKYHGHSLTKFHTFFTKLLFIEQCSELEIVMRQWGVGGKISDIS